MRSFDELAEEAKWGEITPEEITYVAQRLKDFQPGKDDDDLLITLLYTLGHAWAAEYRDLVEKYVYYRRDTLVCGQALKTLCTCWRLTKDYLDVIKNYIRGLEWDDADEVRLIAMSISGGYLRKNFDRDLLQLLMDIFEHLGEKEGFLEPSDYARDFIKSCAYTDIARAMGKDWEEIPDTDEVERALIEKKFHLLDTKMLDQAHEMLRNKTK